MERKFDVISATYQGESLKSCKAFKELAKKEYGSVSRALKVLIEKYLIENKALVE
mgnify:CR=1 FL=1